MYPRHRLDVRITDLVFPLVRCLVPIGRGPRVDDGLVTLSVRSAWDLLLGTLALPPGSEVLMSAVTHPDMARIARAHGLSVVPVDIDLDTLAPGQPQFSERTRVFCIAHLFGGEVDLAPYAEAARARGVLIVEDRAQTFVGTPGALTGDPNADVSLFSFGTIKTATALGGGIALVRDAALLERMRAAHDAWPWQTRSSYAKKLLKGLVLVLAQRPRMFGRLITVACLLGRDVDRLLSESVRGFPPSEDAFLAAIRRRPCTALTALLARRLANVDQDRIAQRRAYGERLAVSLERFIRVPGRRARRRTHWLFPVLTDDAIGLASELRRAGFDAAQRTSAIAAIADDAGNVPQNAEMLISRILFLPAYPEMPESELGRMASVVGGVAGEAAVRARAAGARSR